MADLTVSNDIAVALVNALVPTFLAVTTAVIGVIGAAARGWIKAHTTDAQVGALQRIAAIAVNAAEQLYGEAEGEQKKAYALAYIQAELDSRGIKVDVAALDALIEAAVMEQFNFPAVEPTEPPADPAVVVDPALDPDFDTGDLA